MKIAVIEHSGSGKSTVAKILADMYKIPLLHLEKVQFKPGWIERDLEEGLEIVRNFMKNKNIKKRNLYSLLYRFLTFSLDSMIYKLNIIIIYN